MQCRAPRRSDADVPPCWPGRARLRPWIEQQLESRARAAYFERGRAYAPRVLEELGPLPPELREASGLAVSRTQPGVLWAHNDSGDTPTLYAIDSEGHAARESRGARRGGDRLGRHCRRSLPRTTSATTHCLYIADTGNNSRARDVLTVYIVDEPSISGADPGGRSR